MSSPIHKLRSLLLDHPPSPSPPAGLALTSRLGASFTAHADTKTTENTIKVSSTTAFTITVDKDSALPRSNINTTTASAVLEASATAVLNDTRYTPAAVDLLFQQDEYPANMRFTSPVRPALTPFGHRLLHLSESKLADLESPYDASALWKGVVVREAVKAAWRSVDSGSVADLNDWRRHEAMGLDVIGEDDEDEYDDEDAEAASYIPGGREERWFEELVSSFGDDEDEAPVEHEWVESNVSIPEFDDYEYEGEAYTFPLAPSPPSSPLVTPTADPTSEWIVRVVAAADVDVEDEDEPEPELETQAAQYAEVAIADIDAASDMERPARLRQWRHGGLEPVTPSLLPHPSPLSLAPVASLPITPVPSPVDSDYDYALSFGIEEDDADECADDFMLPPPLHRSFSSASSIDGDGECECFTPPPESCEELEDEIGEEDLVVREVNLLLGAGGKEEGALGLDFSVLSV